MGSFSKILYRKNNLECLTTKFQKSSKQFIHANGAKTQLEHILKNKNWKNSTMNCQTYLKEHRQTICSITRLSLRTNKKRPSTFPPYVWSLLTNSHLKDQYTFLSGISLKHYYKQMPRNHFLIQPTIILLSLMKRLQQIYYP